MSQGNELLLNKIAENLDISETKFDEAEGRYKSLASWFEQEGSLLAPFSPALYPQGSFALGTVVRPLTDEDDFDFDLVCELKVSRSNNTQSALKNAVRQRLVENSNYKRMLAKDEGRRCWTLNYAEGSQFHVDILPSIPEDEAYKLHLQQQGVLKEYTDTSISITDNTLWNFDSLEGEWPKSNPKGYLKWFQKQMQPVFQGRRMALAEALRKSIDEIPEYRVKTPLQRAIQILKRHRDVMFQEAPKNKPISIIITTLAAHAYENDNDLVTTLSKIIKGMESKIERRTDGRLWVPNPVNPMENFADKWIEVPEKQIAFFAWMKKVKEDFNDLNLINLGDSAYNNQFEKFLGESVIARATGGNQRLPALRGSREVVADDPERARHRQPAPWVLQNIVPIKITAHVTAPNGFSSGQINSYASVPKKSSVEFNARFSIRPPYDVYWQVTNTGDEAGADLRGGFDRGTDTAFGSMKTESTRYKGKHSVQCFVVKDGVCVGRSGLFIVNIEGGPLF